MRTFKITVNGTVYDVQAEETTGGVVSAQPVAAQAPAPAAPAAPAPKPAAPAPAPTAAASGDPVTAPMPGTILSVAVASGAHVKKHDLLCVLEAMKMENEIVAPRDGVVAQVLVNKGSTVSTGDKLIILS